MQQFRKNHHYVPKLYLKQWARDGFIPTYRLLVANENVPLWKHQSLTGIAFHQHLYTYLMGQGETDEFERWLDNEFENPAAEAIRRVVREDRMLPEHWRRLVRFALSLDVRTPARMREFLSRQDETLQALMTETMKRSVDNIESAIKNNEPFPSHQADNETIRLFNISTEALPDGSSQLKAETIIGRRLWIWQMKHLLTETVKRLPVHRWTILHAPPGILWPTSDNPFIRLNFQDEKNYNFRSGWGVRNGDLILPLSPKHLLYTSIGNINWQRGTVPDIETAKLLRKIIIEHADRYVFAQEPGDIHLIRPRVVCYEKFNNEALVWREWHYEQSRAEKNFQS